MGGIAIKSSYVTWWQSVKQNREVTVWGMLCGCEVMTACVVCLPAHLADSVLLCWYEKYIYLYETGKLGNKLFSNVLVVHSYNINDQHYICGEFQEEINWEKAHCCSGQNLLSSHHISNAWSLKNTKLHFYVVFVCSMHNIIIVLFFYVKIPVMIIYFCMCLWCTSSTVFLRDAKKILVHSEEIYRTGQHSAALIMATCECKLSTKRTYTQNRYL